MITVTSAEKTRIEGQMKTALPFLNGQITFELSIEEGTKGRSRLTFKKDSEIYRLPFFYVTPSTDDSDWEILTDRIEEEAECPGIFIIKFNSDQHMIQNATTYALTDNDLYEKNVLSEMCRLCSYFDFEPYQLQIFNSEKVNEFFERLQKKDEKVKELDIEETTTMPIEPLKEMQQEETLKQEEKVIQHAPIQPSTSPVPEEDKKIDSDIRALINDCFGLF